MATDSEIHTLHRYFIWMDRMRVHFDKILKENNGKIKFESKAQIETFLYMSYWYGGMYVVIEGWNELGLNDGKVNGLLNSSEYVDLLRRYRNGVFHFQKTYYDERFEDLWSSSGIVLWIRNLREAFSQFFLNRSQKLKERSQLLSSDLTIFCNDWLQSWTGNQPEKLLSFYSEDASYSDPAHPEGLRGHSQILPYFQKLLAKNPDWVWKALEIIPTEKGFTLKWQAMIPVKEKTVQVVGLDIVELRDGKIARNEVYFDPTSLRE